MLATVLFLQKIGAALLVMLVTACGGGGSHGGGEETAASGGAAAEAAPRRTWNGLIAVGERAPAFTAPDQTGQERQLAEFRGQPVVLYFYPKDATPGCTREACAFRDAWDRLQATGAVVLGVSTDSVASHAAFAEEHRLPFPLLADPGGERVCAPYGASRNGGFARRVTYLIDAEGIIRQVYPNVDPGVHANEVLAALAELTTGGDGPKDG
jgi:peroxiredoxin Q/BCP